MRFGSDAEVLDLVERFERCEIGLAEFDHACHLAVGLAYLAESDLEGAMVRMRSRLQRFSAHHGKMGYHETITRFWLLKLAALKHEGSLWRTANKAGIALADKTIIFDYYEREVLLSETSRQKWIDPTKRRV